MIIGVPRETLRHEHRVGLTPFGVSKLVPHGHEVHVEHDAGKDSHFTDQDYTEVGAKIVYSREEVYGRSGILCRVGRLSAEEIDLMQPGTTVTGYLHFALTPRDLLQKMIDQRLTLIGYEVVEDGDGEHPILRSMSEIAGHMAVHTASHLLEFEAGGRGLILGGIPGIPPSTVLVVGAGTVGWTAARLALAAGAHVIVLDEKLERLRHGMQHGCQNAVTALATPQHLERFIAIADVVVGSVLIPGGRAPDLITEAMVKTMKPDSVILDISIDQGGCVETSRPTSADQPTFKIHGVTHYCVPNMTANAPRTASRALTIAALPYLEEIATLGLDEALRRDPPFARGVYLYKGAMTHAIAARTLGLEARPVSDLLGR
jgi:alanine dehydrogenase